MKVLRPDSRGVEAAPWLPQGLRGILILIFGVITALIYRRPARA